MLVEMDKWLNVLARVVRKMDNAIHQAPVVGRLHNAIHWLNSYPADTC